MNHPSAAPDHSTARKSIRERVTGGVTRHDRDLVQHVGFPFASQILRDGYVPPATRSLFEELDAHGGFSVGTVNGVKNRAGNWLATVLAQDGGAHLIPALRKVKGVSVSEFEPFLGKLLALYRGRDNRLAHEYVWLIRNSRIANAYNAATARPVFQMLVRDYFRYLLKIDTDQWSVSQVDWLEACRELIRESLSLPGSDPNMNDQDGCTVMDYIDFYDPKLKDPRISEMLDSVVRVLVDSGADFNVSSKWMLSDNFIVRRPSPEELARERAARIELAEIQRAESMGQTSGTNPYTRAYMDMAAMTGDDSASSSI